MIENFAFLKRLGNFLSKREGGRFLAKSLVVAVISNLAFIVVILIKVVKIKTPHYFAPPPPPPPPNDMAKCVWWISMLDYRAHLAVQFVWRWLWSRQGSSV